MTSDQTHGRPRGGASSSDQAALRGSAVFALLTADLPDIIDRIHHSLCSIRACLPADRKAG